MVETAVTVLAICFALYWSGRVRKKQTKSLTILLALISLIQFDNFLGLAPYQFYLFTCVSIVAGVEPSNSLNLKVFHKAFFLVSAGIFVLVALTGLLKLPFAVNLGILGAAYLGITLLAFIYKPYKLKSRLGYVVIWGSYAVNWII